MNSGPPELEEIYVFGNQLVIYYLPCLPTYHTLPKLITFVIQWRRFATTDWHTHLLFLRRKIVKVYIQAGWAMLCSDIFTLSFGRISVLHLYLPGSSIYRTLYIDEGER